MLATCFSTARSETTSAPAMAPLERPSAISVSTSRSRGVSVASPPVRRLAPNSWGTTSGARAGAPGGAAAGGRAEQVGRVAGLDVLGEHQHPRPGVLAPDGDRGPQALVGEPG